MGQLNIKDEALIADAKALADLLGTSTTAALREAVQARLAAERAARDDKVRRKYEALMATGLEAAKLFEPGTGSDHSYLYDENGLPV
jgi:hypothetical protein